jgi:hypothetical protein
MDAEKESRDTQKYAKNDNQETVETNNQTEIDLQNKSRHAIDEINRSVKNIILKTEWSFTLS